MDPYSEILDKYREIIVNLPKSPNRNFLATTLAVGGYPNAPQEAIETFLRDHQKNNPNRLLTFEEGSEYISKAFLTMKANPCMRFGQSLFNVLPLWCIRMVTGTSQDFFNTSDHEKVFDMFWDALVDS
jgi:hypothetical protein